MNYENGRDDKVPNANYPAVRRMIKICRRANQFDVRELDEFEKEITEAVGRIRYDPKTPTDNHLARFFKAENKEAENAIRNETALINTRLEVDREKHKIDREYLLTLPHKPTHHDTNLFATDVPSDDPMFLPTSSPLPSFTDTDFLEMEESARKWEAAWASQAWSLGEHPLTLLEDDGESQPSPSTPYEYSSPYNSTTPRGSSTPADPSYTPQYTPSYPSESRPATTSNSPSRE
ncbi:hypothetical protein HDV00_003512 [Rhizophlyctis rosea]|nr:hypothetical protein HDV00_003512 [Rhizophlyctis rosea]